MAFTAKTAKKAGKKSTRKGVPNKSTGEIKEAFQLLVSGNLDNMSKWLNDIAKNNPEKAFELVIKLSDFIVPKLSRQEIREIKKPVSEMSRPEKEARLKELIETVKKRGVNFN